MKKGYFSFTISFLVVPFYLFLVVYIDYKLFPVMDSWTDCLFAVVINYVLIERATSSFTYPVIESDMLKMRWFFWPFMNREFFYKDIDHIQFTSWKGPVMRIVLKNGRTKTYNGLDCMKMRDLPVFIQDLIDHGVTVDNQLKTKGRT